MNTFHDHAPASLKMEYAFKIYDFNEDDLLDVEDLEVVVNRLVNVNEDLSDMELENIIKNVFLEADLDQDRSLSFAEFEHVIMKSSNFTHSFRTRVLWLAAAAAAAAAAATEGCSSRRSSIKW